LDAGLILVPLSHQATQGATNLQNLDYSANAFLQSGPMGSSTGRDGGVQLRGIVGKTRGNLEFRVGVFQGKRNAQTATYVNSDNAPRIAARAQWNFFDSEGGLFLGGTYLGAKKVLSVGVGYDTQDDYSAMAFDVFVDMPIGNNAIMGQYNHVIWDGGDWLPTLVKQTTDFAEVGFRLGELKLSPIVRFENKTVDSPTLAIPNATSETRMGAGLAWWFKGNQNNLKLFYTRIDPKNPAGLNNLSAYDHVNLQWQVLFW
jgi:hypothetical protein